MPSVSVNITIKNMPELRAAFAKAPKIMGEEFKQALLKSGLKFQQRTIPLTPHRTGRLQASFYDGGNGGLKLSGGGLGMSLEVGPHTDYAYFVHEGTRFMKARPFLKWGADQSQNDIDEIFTKAAQSGLDSIGRMT